MDRTRGYEKVRTRRRCGLHDFVIRELRLEGHAIGRILWFWMRIKRILCIGKGLFVVHVQLMLMLLMLMVLRIHLKEDRATGSSSVREGRRGKNGEEREERDGDIVEDRACLYSLLVVCARKRRGK